MPGNDGRNGRERPRLNSDWPGPPPEAPTAQVRGPSLRKRVLTVAHSLVGGVRSSSGPAPAPFARSKPVTDEELDWKAPRRELRPAGGASGGGARGTRTPRDAPPGASLPAHVLKHSLGQSTRPEVPQSGGMPAAAVGDRAEGEAPSHVPSPPFTAVSEASNPVDSPQEGAKQIENAAEEAALAAAGPDGYYAALRAALRAQAARSNALDLETIGENDRLSALIARKLTGSSDGAAGATTGAAAPAPSLPPFAPSPAVLPPHPSSKSGLTTPEELSSDLSLPPPGLSPPPGSTAAPGLPLPHSSPPSLPSDYDLDF